MAVTRKPTDYFPGYTSGGTSITIPIAALDGITAAEADASTGDAFEILRGIVAAFHAAYSGQDQSTRLKTMRSSYIDEETQHIVQTFGITFDLTPGSVNVSGEPSA